MVYPFLHTWDRSRYDHQWLLMCPTEDNVQKQLLTALAFRGIFAFPVDSGDKNLRGRAYGAMKRAGREDLIGHLHGRSASYMGVSDIIGTMPNGRSLYIEAKAPEWLTYGKRKDLVQKRPAGRPTEEQLAFLLDAHEHKAIVGVAWSPKDLEIILGD